MSKEASRTGQYSAYIFGATDDRERLMVQHTCFQSGFLQIFQQELLPNYGLMVRLEAAKTNGQKVRILDIGCGEGLFLHDIASILETSGFLEVVEFYGFDRNVEAIATAEAYSKISNPPRPNFNFYVWDATRPLEECEALRLDFGSGVPLTFDFIYATMVMEHIPNLYEHLKRYYLESLKSGGVLYLRDAVVGEGPSGWLVPHPAMQPVFSFGAEHLLAVNEGIEITEYMSVWLKEWGATQVVARPDVLPIGGSSQLGLNVLRNMLMIFRNIGPLLVKLGRLSQAQYEEALQILNRELGPHLQGQWTLVDTLARKP
jgi:SAM-dependent methyltransferase